MKIIVIGSRAYNELVGRIEKIEAAIASLPEKGRAWNKEYINDEWMDGEQVCRYLGISGRTLQRLRSDHVITYSAINRKLYYSLTEIRRVLKERSVRRKNQPKSRPCFWTRNISTDGCSGSRNGWNVSRSCARGTWSNRFPSCLTGSVFWTITTCAVCSISASAPSSVTVPRESCLTR